MTYCVAHYIMVIRNQERGDDMKKDEIVSGFLGELRRGNVVLCVLAMLGEATYGYGLIEKLSDTGISVEANTLYPLLRRLEGQGLLQSTWNTDTAKPRKYYELTEFGKEVKQQMKEEWLEIGRKMNDILEGEI